MIELSETFDDAFPSAFRQPRGAEMYVVQVGHLDQEDTEEGRGAAGEVV